MIYIDSRFRFYDDSKDLDKFPELKPIPEAVALTDEQVSQITSDITQWRWNPVLNQPYKLPDCQKIYWKTVDGVILEMDASEKSVVDQAIADEAARKAAEEAVRLAAEQEAAAIEKARIAAKMQAIADNLPTWKEMSDDIDGVSTIAGLKVVVKKMARVLYWLAKDRED